MPLKIDVYSIMRNEIKILPYFLRHYETFADRIFVWDDGSDDGTREMLEAHPKVKILPLSLGRVDDVYFVECLWPQYRKISRGYADWVLCVDADEFIYYPNIVEKLKELGVNGIKKIRCCGFTMYHPTFPTTDGQIYDEVKTGVKDLWSTKTVVFNPDVKMSWGEGRHKCSPTRYVETSYTTGINLLHFRYLGWEYFLERTKRNYAYTNIVFDEKRKCPLPDGSWGIPYEWYEKQKDKLIRVVE